MEATGLTVVKSKSIATSTLESNAEILRKRTDIALNACENELKRQSTAPSATSEIARRRGELNSVVGMDLHKLLPAKVLGTVRQKEGRGDRHGGNRLMDVPSSETAITLESGDFLFPTGENWWKAGASVIRERSALLDFRLSLLCMTDDDMRLR